MKRILVPTDFSKHAEYALKVAAQIAKKNDGEIFLLHMLELPTTGNDALSRAHDIPELMFFKNAAVAKLDELMDADYLNGVKISRIIQFEMAEDKSKVLNEVIFKFDKVLLVTNNHIYENYLAYILIDFNINVSKGVTLVKKALVQEPNNLAYIDTLAWGQYKLKNCKEANKQMKRVVDEIGLNDEEIKLHWEKIKECKK